MTILYKLQGRNGATYFFNLESYSALKSSSIFYTPLGRLSKIFQTFLFSYLPVIRLVPRLARLDGNVKNTQEVVGEICNTLNILPVFTLEKGASCFLSSTRTKLIIQRSGQYFEKISIKDASESLEKEYKIYQILVENYDKLLFSRVVEFENNATYSRLKLTDERSGKCKNKEWNISASLLSALVEFFDIQGQGGAENLTWNNIISQIENQNNIKIETFNLLKRLIDGVEINDTIKLGLIHGDFKPWNIDKVGNKYLIYDFEESRLHGYPFVDIFNYIVEPAIRTNQDSHQIEKRIIDAQKTGLLRWYAEKLCLNGHIQAYFGLYVFHCLVTSYFSENHERVLLELSENIIKKRILQ